MASHTHKHKDLHTHWEQGIPEPEVLHGPQHTRDFKLRCRQFDTQYMDQVLKLQKDEHKHRPQEDESQGAKHLKWDGHVMEPEHDAKNDEAFRAHRKRFYQEKMDQARKLLHDTSEHDEDDSMDVDKE